MILIDENRNIPYDSFYSDELNASWEGKQFFLLMLIFKMLVMC